MITPLPKPRFRISLIQSAAMGMLFSCMALATQAQALELVAEFDTTTPPANIAIGADGRIFLSVHGGYGQALRLMELMPDGTVKPYPNEAWAHKPTKAHPEIGLNGILGVNVDRDGILWMLENTWTPEHADRLIGWDTVNEKLHRIIRLPAPITRPDTVLNDLAIDRDNEHIYITDAAGPNTSAIIVVDLKTGQARRVLQGTAPTQPEDIDIVIDGKVVNHNGKPTRISINPITIDAKNEYVYFGPMSSLSLYRINTQALRDAALSSDALLAQVERVGDKRISDGITIDGAGNVYISALSEKEVGVTKPDGTYQTLHQHNDLAWIDGLAFGADGYVYASVNELHKSPVFNQGKNHATGNFKLFRFKALAPGQTGR